MKKLLFFTFTLLFIFSCEKENLNESDYMNDTLLQSRSSCTIINANPITNQSVTFSGYCLVYPNSDCLSDELMPLVEDEIWNQFYDYSIYLDRPVSTFIENVTFQFNLSDVIDTNGILPIMTATKANLVYDEVVCRIADYLNSQPPLPTDSFYSADIYSIWIDFKFGGGPQNGFVIVNYDLLKWD